MKLLFHQEMLQHRTPDRMPVVVDHLLEHIRLSDQNHHLRRTRHRRVQQVPRQEHRRARIQRNNHHRIFAPLTFMHRDRVRMIHFVKLCRVKRADALVKCDGHKVVLRVNVRHDADVAVLDAHTGLAVVRFPFNFVVVFRLHDPVSDAENHVAGLFFRLSNEKGATLAGADSPRALQAFRNPGKEYRAEKRILYNQKVLECAVSLAPFYKRQQRLFQSILFIFLALLPLGMFAGYLVASYMTKGLKKIRNAALKISAGDLAHRVNWEENSLAGGEIGSLVSAFNTMSANNERLVTELRTVTDDIAHDLRTPLTRIRGTAELSVMKCSSRSCREAYGSIAEECDAMISIIGDMLEISRSETGIRKPEKTCFSLTQLLEKLFEVYKMTAEELGQKWKLQLPEKEIQIHADEIKLQRVFTNLLDNAAKFMGEGGSLFFTLLPPENHFVTMRVADTGPGIPDDCKEKVFKRFFRMDSSRSTSGNGLGLALAAAIIHAHDGTIHVEDTPGGGATFVIKLPLR